MNSEFMDAVAASGITPPIEIIPDGSIHRFSSNGKRGDTAGWYLFSAGGGIFGCWRLGFSETFRVNAGREFTQEEKAVFGRKLAEQKLAREQDRCQQHRAARSTAAEIWGLAGQAPTDFPYLVAKNVKPYGLKIWRGELIVPMRDNGELHSLQFIPHTGKNKRYLSGGRITGCYHAMGSLGSTICIAEGYATAASVHAATGFSTAVAFNTGNLQRVACTIRRKFPHARIILCADDDRETAGNPGITKAREAAKAVGGVVAIPLFAEPRGENTDFNDMAKVSGLEGVREGVNIALAGRRLADAGVQSHDSTGIASFEQILQKIGRYRLVGARQAVADCPFCVEDEELGSLTVAENGTDVRVTCANGCDADEVLEALRGCDHG